MATIEDIRELAAKNRQLAIEDREVITGYDRETLYSGEKRAEVYGRLSSFLIGGMTQQGKSVIAAYHACQFVGIAGARLLMIDPHCNEKRRGLTTKLLPLADWFVFPSVDFSDIDDIISRFEWLEAEYNQRKAPGGMAGKEPILLLIDEANEFLRDRRLSKEQKSLITGTIADTARGGAKHGLFTGIILHNADASKSGGSEVRYNIPTRLAVNCESREQAKILDYDDRRAIEQMCIPPLIPGHALVKRQGHELRIFAYPEVTSAYCVLVADFTREIEYTPIYRESGIPDSTGKNADISIELPAPGISTPSPIALLPIERTIPITSAPVNTSQHTLEFQVFDLEKLNKQKKGVHITEEELKQIIQEGSRQLAETGRVKKGDIVKAMNGNSHTAVKVSMVCQYMGWGLSMNKITPEQRTALLEQAGYKCVECGSPDDLTIDHIIPRVKGGGTEPENLTVLCRSCNSSKGITIL